MSFLGWRSYPIARIGDDPAGSRILEDLKRFSVRTKFVQRSETIGTPIVIESIQSTTSGKPRHKFLWTCPTCGSSYPGYQSIRGQEGRLLAEKLPPASVYFFYRVSRGALELAHASAKRGAVIVFEPSGVKDKGPFEEAIKVSHIVKYSHERLRSIGDFAK